MKYLKSFENTKYYDEGISQDNMISADYYIESQVKTKMFYDWEYDDPLRQKWDSDNFPDINYYFYWRDFDDEELLDVIYNSFETLGIKDIKIGKGLHSLVEGDKDQIQFKVKIDVDNIKKFSDIGNEYEKYNLI